MRIDDLWRAIRHREAVERLPAHLDDRYGIQVANLAPLDAGVYRVDRQGAPSWIARLFPALRPLERAEGDADVLRFLAAQGVAAERLAHAEPVSIHANQAVLITEFIEGTSPDTSETTFRVLGGMLGRLHALPAGEGGAARPGGAIHVFTPREGSLRDEVAVAMSWLADADVPAEHQALYEATCEKIARIDYGADLPQALLHPDPVRKNFIATATGDIVPIDWTGAGRGPRAHGLAFLLLSAVMASRWNPRSARVDAVMDGYRQHVQLRDEEYPAIAAAMPLHIFVRDCAEFCFGRMPFDEVAGGFAAISRLAAIIVGRVAI